MLVCSLKLFVQLALGMPRRLELAQYRTADGLNALLGVLAYLERGVEPL